MVAGSSSEQHGGNVAFKLAGVVIAVARSPLVAVPV